MKPDDVLEAAFVEAFVVKSKKGRTREILAKPKRRRTILEMLPHFPDFDPRWMVKVPWEDRSPEGIERSLRSRGAVDDCYLISANRDLDGRRMPLGLALEVVVDYEPGTIICCGPHGPGYYQGEHIGEFCILDRNG